MQKPFVHLLGPPLGVALDSRIIGNHSGFVRNGCRSNAVLSPVLCGPPAEDETALGFGVFAMRKLKPGVEIILGWEWDDGNAVRRSTCVVDDPIHVTVSFSYFYILFYLALTTFWCISF